MEMPEDLPIAHCAKPPSSQATSQLPPALDTGVSSEVAFAFERRGVIMAALHEDAISGVSRAGILAEHFEFCSEIERPRIQVLKYLNSRVEKEDDDAQSRLGQCLYFASGVEKNEARGLELLQLAAASGNAQAQYTLGIILHECKGLAQNKAKGREWLELAAANGYSRAQSCLGIMYYYGIGIEKNAAKGLELLERAYNDSGSDTARAFFGIRLYHGIDIEKDEAQSLVLFDSSHSQDTYLCAYICLLLHDRDAWKDRIKWKIRHLRFSALRGNKLAQSCFGVILYEGLGMKKNQALGLEFLQLAAARGDVLAQKFLALLSVQLKNLPASKVEALSYAERLKFLEIELLKDAAASGDSGAQYRLGCMLYDARGMDRNTARAIELLELSSSSGHPLAQTKLGEMYYYGDVIEKNQARGLELLELAAACGFSRAQYILGRILYDAEGLEGNRLRGLELLQQAADGGTHGYAVAEFFLGKIYYEGRNMKKNEAKGLEFLNLAAASGYAEAKEYLDNLSAKAAK